MGPLGAFLGLLKPSWELLGILLGTSLGFQIKSRFCDFMFNHLLGFLGMLLGAGGGLLGLLGVS